MWVLVCTPPFSQTQWKVLISFWLFPCLSRRLKNVHLWPSLTLRSFLGVCLFPSDKPLLCFLWQNMKKDESADVLPFRTTCSPCWVIYALSAKVFQMSKEQKKWLRNCNPIWEFKKELWGFEIQQGTIIIQWWWKIYPVTPNHDHMHVCVCVYVCVCCILCHSAEQFCLLVVKCF